MCTIVGGNPMIIIIIVIIIIIILILISITIMIIMIIIILVILWQVAAPLGVLFCNSCHHTPSCVVKMMKKIVMMMINIMMIKIMVGDFLKPPLPSNAYTSKKKSTSSNSIKIEKIVMPPLMF